MRLISIISFKDTKLNSQRKALLFGIIVLFILISTIIYLSYQLINTPYTYSGIYLDGVHVGGLNDTSLKKYIDENYNKDISNLKLNIFHSDYQVTVGFEELNVQIKTDIMYEKVMNYGRHGSIMKRLIEIYTLHKNHAYLKSEVQLNMTTLNNIIDELYDETFAPSEPPSLIVLENEVTLYSGLPGHEVNKEEFKNRILEQVRTLTSGVVIVPSNEILPARIDTESFYNSIVCEPVDAKIQTINGEIEIIPEKTGRSLDKAEFLSLIAKLEDKPTNYSKKITLPVNFTKPEKTVESINNSLFKDILSSYSTQFPVETINDRNRAANIEIAVKAINETLLLPGDTFSFNETVGKRTGEKGYLPANIYSYNGITTGLGGGICQVSSTLYNTALTANLKIGERNPHIYTVAYVPLGRDAAVSYGTQDLRFTNSTGWPIKIEGKVTNGNTVEFSIIGTNENPSIDVVIQPAILEIIPYETQYIEDNSVKADSTTVKQAGMNGAVVDTYFAIKNQNEIISSQKLHSTNYSPLPEIIHIPPQ